jgi:ATP-dependent Lon protease
MTDTRTELLPLLPLNTGVVLPGMVVTITLESDEAKRAAAAAEAVGGRLILVPRIDGRFSTVGTITKIESVGELPNGSRALVVRGTGRARIGSGVPGAEGALSSRSSTRRADSDRGPRVAREYRVVIETVLEHRAGRMLASCPASTSRALADTAASARPDDGAAAARDRRRRGALALAIAGT